MKPKEKKPKDKKCPDKSQCVIKTWMDDKEKVSQCVECNKIINIE
jgi:hypothetical protein